MSNLLVCQVCSYSHPTMISPSHLKTHGMTGAQYKEKYPGFKLRIQTEESRKKQAESKKGKEPWNKGKTTGKNEKLSASKRGKPNLKLQGQKRTQQQKENISAATKLAMSRITPEEKAIQSENKRVKRQELITSGWISPLKGTVCPQHVKEKIRSTTLTTFAKKRNEWLQELDARLAADNITALSLTAQNVNLVCNNCQTNFTFTRQYFSPSSQLYHNSRIEKICPSCYPREVKKSKLEVELLEWCRSVRPDLQILSGNRTAIFPYELDIWIPELKIAIEVTGTYWHTEKVAEKYNRTKYHLYEKYLKCKENGIRLFTIYEDEIVTQRQIVLSRLKHQLCKTEKALYARKFEIREIPAKVSSTFLNENHIQRADRPLISLGAFLNDELLSVMTFKKTTFVKGGDGSQIELSRFASKLNVSIVGIASKFLSFFNKNFNHEKLDIISYSDNRWSDGNVYRQIGFKQISNSKPGYFYVYMKSGELQGIRIHRSNFMKHRLEKIFRKKMDLSLSEYELLQQEGYDRIWDCGTTKWLLSSA